MPWNRFGWRFGEQTRLNFARRYNQQQQAATRAIGSRLPLGLQLPRVDPNAQQGQVAQGFAPPAPPIERVQQRAFAGQADPFAGAQQAEGAFNARRFREAIQTPEETASVLELRDALAARRIGAEEFVAATEYLRGAKNALPSHMQRIGGGVLREAGYAAPTQRDIAQSYVRPVQEEIDRPSRTVRDPRTGEMVQVPAGQLTPAARQSYRSAGYVPGSIGGVLEAERQAIQPLTRPVFERFGKEAARSVPVAGEFAGFREAAGEAVGEVGAELALPSNLIPIPLIDPVFGRAAGLAFRGGERVARPVLDRIAARAAREAVENTDPAVRVAAEETGQRISAALAEQAPAAGVPSSPGLPPAGELPSPGAVAEGAVPAEAPQAAVGAAPETPPGGGGVSAEVGDVIELKRMADEELTRRGVAGARRLDAKQAQAEAQTRIEVMDEIVQARLRGESDDQILQRFQEELDPTINGSLGEELMSGSQRARSASTTPARLRREAKVDQYQRYLDEGSLPDSEALSSQQEAVKRGMAEAYPRPKLASEQTPRERLRGLKTALARVPARATKANSARRATLMKQIGALEEEIATAPPPPRPRVAEVPVERPTGAQTFGQTRYRPEMGSQRPEFRGEQGGVQPGMFTPEEAGLQGQGRLEDALAPVPAAPSPRAATLPPTVGQRVITRDGEMVTVVNVKRTKGGLEVQAMDDEGRVFRGPPDELLPAMRGGADTLLPAQQKLIDAIRQARQLKPEQRLMQQRERARRFAAARGAMGRAHGEARLKAGLGTLKGKLGAPEFEPIGPQFVQDERNSLFEQINDFYADKPLGTTENIRAMGGLEKLFLGEIPQPGELKLLHDVFGADLVRALPDTRTIGKKALDEVTAVLNSPRSLMSQYDLSAILRQAALAGPGHPKEVYGNTANYVRYFAKEKNFQQAMREIREHPLFIKADKDGLFLPGVREVVGEGEEAFLATSERTFIGRLLGRLPGVRPSQRGYTGYLTKVRWDMYRNNIANVAQGDGEAFASLVNALTGRGKLGPLEKYADLLNTVFFAPRLQAGRATAPFYLFHKSPAVRKMAARDMLAFVGTGASIMSALKVSGLADVELDPRSTDWGKIKVGPTRIDLWGGMQPMARFVVRMATGQQKTSTGGFVDIERDVAAWDFLRTKFAPVPGLAADIQTGRTFSGEEVEATGSFARTEAKNLVTPLFIQDIVDAVQESGWQHGALAAPFGLFGAGVLSYTTPAVLMREAFKEKALAGAFGEEYKARPDYDGERGDRALAEGDPDLSVLLKQADAEALRRQSEFAVEREGRRLFIDQKQRELRLPSLAREMANGSTAAPEQFRYAISDLRSAAADVTAMDFFGDERELAATPEGRAYQHWATLRPEDYADDDAYFTEKDRLFEELPDTLRQAIEQRVRSLDPTVQGWERKLNDDRRYIEDQAFEIQGLGQVAYWDAQDAVHRLFQERYDDVPDMRELMELERQGTDEGDRARNILSEISKTTTRIREHMRGVDPELDARGFYWGYWSTLMRSRQSVDAFERLYPQAEPPRVRAAS